MSINEPTVVREASKSELRAVKYQFSHTFVIDNFSSYYNNPPPANTTSNDHPEILSPKFGPEKDSKLQFQLAVYPKSVSDDRKDFVSIFLRGHNLDDVPIRFSVWLVDSKGKLRHKKCKLNF